MVDEITRFVLAEPQPDLLLRSAYETRRTADMSPAAGGDYGSMASGEMQDSYLGSTALGTWCPTSARTRAQRRVTPGHTTPRSGSAAVSRHSSAHQQEET